MRRAPSVGRQTRHITARAKRAPVLPFAYKIHPQRAAPTPVHPECDSATYFGVAIKLAKRLSIEEFYVGAELEQQPCTYKLTHTPTRRLLGQTNDLMFAMGWRKAADMVGLSGVEVSE